MMPPVSDANDSIGATGDAVTAEVVVHIDDTTNGNANSANPLLAPMIKANHNTVVVVAESVTQRPDAAEARRRRKERLLKQSKQHQAKSDKIAASVTSTNGGSGAIVVDHNAVAEAATLAAVAAAAAAAAVDASVELVSAEVIDNAVYAAAPTGAIEALAQGNNEMNGSSSAAGATDIPFLDDADIAATAAAVAMNSVTTTTATTTANSNNTGTIAKNKVPKRKRQADKNKGIDIARNNDDCYDDYNDMDNEEDDYDEDGNPLSGNGNNKKTQIRYDPSIPMEKEQLAAWRREARRVRNRESAAASRQRIRGRITELEDELDIMKQKYERAMQRIQQLQGQGAFRPAES